MDLEALKAIGCEPERKNLLMIVFPGSILILPAWPGVLNPIVSTQRVVQQAGVLGLSLIC